MKRNTYIYIYIYIYTEYVNSPNEANLNLLILGSVAVVQARVKTGMLLSLSNKLFGRDEVDDASSSGTAARLTALSSVPVTSMANERILRSLV